MSEPTESKLNLAQAIFDKIEKLGTAEAAVFFKRTESTVKKWAGGATPDINAAQRILDDAIENGGIELPAFSTPPEQGQTIPDVKPKEAPAKKTAVTDGAPEDMKMGELVKIAKKAKKFSILAPAQSGRPMSYVTVQTYLGTWKATLPPEIRDLLATIDFEPDTTPHFARNRLATRFLESGNEWSCWIDTDMVCPTGNPHWFKKKTGYKWDNKWFAKAAIERLSSHGKTIVGAAYAQRSLGGKIIAAPGLTPRGQGDQRLADDIKSEGPQDKLHQMDWIGFGCVVVHRSVFEDILKTQPETAAKTEGGTHDFFTAYKTEDGGGGNEDIAFCRRAAKAGHLTYMDQGVFCSHLGLFAFNV